ARLEQPALIGVGTLEHRDMVELTGREGRMQVERQEFRAGIGRDAEAAEDAFIREELRYSQSLKAGQGQVAATECVRILLGERVAKGVVSGKRWHVVIHVRTALDDRSAEQRPPCEAPKGVRGGEMRRDAEAAG